VRSRLGEWLRQAGLIEAADLERAIEEHRSTGDRLGAVLSRRRLVTEQQLADALASQLGFIVVDLAVRPVDPAVVSFIPRDLAQRAACIAIAMEGDALIVAMADPLLFSLVQELERRTARRISEVVATESSILAAIETYYPTERGDDDAPIASATKLGSTKTMDGPAFSRAPSEDPAAVIEAILALAGEMDAADVHIDPAGDELVVRTRIGGALVPKWSKPIALHEEVVARLKLLAGLDVSEKLLPQSGRIDAAESGSPLRLWTLRTAFGEKVVLRSLRRTASTRSLDEIGLSRVGVVEFRSALRESSGLLLIAGPRGAGRSTTVAAALSELAASGRTVVLIEQFAEFRIEGVTQLSIDAAVDLSTSRVMAAALSQRPDVIGLDVPVDRDTATSMAAASADALIVASVTAADGASAIDAVAALLERDGTVARIRAATGQRLLRQLCPACRRDRTQSSEDVQFLQLAMADAFNGSLFEPVGCAECGFTGYRGRTAIFEVIRNIDAVREVPAERASAERIRHTAAMAGIVSLADETRRLLESGTTTIDELQRVFPDIRSGRTTCAQCGALVLANFAACPECGSPQAGVCMHCARPLQRGWSFCPYCARPADRSTRADKRGRIRLVRNPDSSDTV
jgi:type IV pilus assembly protein PilB